MYRVIRGNVEIDTLQDIYEIIDSIGFKFEPDICERKSIDQYFKLCKTFNQVERFNFHSDYWGDEGEYQEDNLQLFETLENNIGINNYAKMKNNGDVYVGKLLGIAIDKQYNSVSHTRVVFDEFKKAE